MTPAKLFIFHPSPVMVQELDRLLADEAPDIIHENVVVPDLLDKAGDTGFTPELKQKVREIIQGIPQIPPAVILCSCSTYGGCVEAMAPFTSNRIIRIDRPMAEHAVAMGSRIGLAAALESTLTPTRELLESVAENSSKKIQIKELLCSDAWAYKQKGDSEAYISKIAQYLENVAGDLDVIVLAQGSMAPAAERLKHLGIPVLSSPRLAIEKVAQICRETRAN
jgi:hypothetical protein